jgi:Protein of unknown function (DUF2953).
VPAPELAFFLAVVLLGIFALFCIGSVFFTSLAITAWLRREGSDLSLCGRMCWGIVGIQFRWEQGCGVLQIRALNHALWSKILSQEVHPPVSHVAQKSSTSKQIPWMSLLPEALLALGYLGRHLRIRAVSADLVLGFPSAPTTGMVYGYVHAIRGILSPVSQVSLNMTPDFDRTVCDGRLSCTLEVRYPLILGFRLLQMGLRQPMRNVLRMEGIRL